MKLPSSYLRKGWWHSGLLKYQGGMLLHGLFVDKGTHQGSFYFKKKRALILFALVCVWGKKREREGVERAAMCETVFWSCSRNYLCQTQHHSTTSGNLRSFPPSTLQTLAPFLPLAKAGKTAKVSGTPSCHRNPSSAPWQLLKIRAASNPSTIGDKRVELKSVLLGLGHYPCAVANLPNLTARPFTNCHGCDSLFLYAWRTRSLADSRPGPQCFLNWKSVNGGVGRWGTVSDQA